jgi:hypothetical protein
VTSALDDPGLHTTEVKHVIAEGFSGHELDRACWCRPAVVETPAALVIHRRLSLSQASCGASLSCRLPILHAGKHERADGVRWKWPRGQVMATR